MHVRQVTPGEVLVGWTVILSGAAYSSESAETKEAVEALWKPA